MASRMLMTGNVPILRMYRYMRVCCRRRIASRALLEQDGWPSGSSEEGARPGPGVRGKSQSCHGRGRTVTIYHGRRRDGIKIYDTRRPHLVPLSCNKVLYCTYCSAVRMVSKVDSGTHVAEMRRDEDQTGPDANEKIPSDE